MVECKKTIKKTICPILLTVAKHKTVILYVYIEIRGNCVYVSILFKLFIQHYRRSAADTHIGGDRRQDQTCAVPSFHSQTLEGGTVMF